MDKLQTIQNMKNEMERNLTTNILPFWREFVPDEVHGGFYGKVNGQREPDLRSPKSVVLNCRILWTFSRAYDMLGNEIDRQLAKRAFDYVTEYFWDDTYQGVYWMVTAKGEPAELEKRTYGQAFFIYSLAEYYRVFRDAKALNFAMKTFELVEQYMKRKDGGYADSATRDWILDDWVNFWVKNRTGAPKLLNSNMHLFEAILALAEVTKNPKVMESLKEQLLFLINTAADPSIGHMKAAMSEDGSRLDGEMNYGHDCECAYLMLEAARFLDEQQKHSGDERTLFARTETVVDQMMEHVYKTGLDPVNGGMYYIEDARTGEINRSKIWWVQAEGVTAFFDAWQRIGDERYLEASVSIWNYIERYMVNHELGEWYSVGSNRQMDTDLQEEEKSLRAVFTNDEMAGKGKCPYHNSRVCMEIIKRAESVIPALSVS